MEETSLRCVRLKRSRGAAGRIDKSGDAVSSAPAYLNHLISRYLPQNREARIVDLGCGHGAFLYFLLRAGYTRIVGVDTSPERIELAHRLGIPQAELGGVAEFLAAREESSCDVVVLMDSTSLRRGCSTCSTRFIAC